MAFIQNGNFEFVEVSNEKIAGLARGKFVVALDFDGVITAPYYLKATYINELGYKITPKESGKEDCLQLGVKKEDYDVGSIKAYTEKPSILPLENGFLKNFKQIRDLKNVFIAIVTSRYDSMLAHLEDYLKHHKISVDAVIHTRYTNKAGPLALIKTSVFVEDTLSKLIDAKKEFSGDYCKFIFYRNIQNSNHKLKDSDVVEMDNWVKLKEFILSEYELFAEHNRTPQE